MRVIITCGPSFEPIDEVRRITNFSTGELGLRLAGQLTAAGWGVCCFRGQMATWHDPRATVETTPFSTNDDLLEKLAAAASAHDVMAVFHAAALADFRVSMRGSARKISSADGPRQLALKPTKKLLPELRALFPSAHIVAWKYELDGTREEALSKARAQIAASSTDACVVNGSAYGDGFGLLGRDGVLTHFPDKLTLCGGLLAWLSARSVAPSVFPAR